MTSARGSIRPLGDRVFVRRRERNPVRPSGLILPDQASAAPMVMEAEVIAVGPGGYDLENNWRPAPEVQPGDLVLVTQYAGCEVYEYEDRSYIVVWGMDVLAIIDENHDRDEVHGVG